MASSREFLEYVLEQLSDLSGITYKPMMGEFLLYLDGKLFGGVYDDRFLIKSTDFATKTIPNAPLELPYEGAKPMLLVEDLDDKTFLTRLIAMTANELPVPKKRKSVVCFCGKKQVFPLLACFPTVQML